MNVLKHIRGQLLDKYYRIRLGLVLTVDDEQRHCDPCSAKLREVKAPEEHMELSR